MHEMNSNTLSSANPSLGSRSELVSPPSEARGNLAASAVLGSHGSARNTAAGLSVGDAPKTKAGVGTKNGEMSKRSLRQAPEKRIQQIDDWF